MKVFLSCTVLVLFPLFVHAQCLTDFSKLIPESSVDAAIGFGNAVSMYDNYLAVGIPYDDSLGRATGIVYIYELVAGTWQKIAAMAPDDPADGVRFGITVKLTQNYLLVGAQRNGGKVYLFNKGTSGWTSGTQLTTFSYPATSYFGIHSNRGLSVSDDEQTIAIADPYYHTGSMPLSRNGAIIIYHKSLAAEWDGNVIPSIIISPEDDCADFGTTGAAMLGNRLVTATPYAPTGIGRIYVYKDSSPGFQNVTLEAKLDPGVASGPFDSYFPGTMSLALTPEGIFVTGVKGLQTTPKFGILFFESPLSGSWSNTTSPTCYIEPKSTGATENRFPFHISSNGTEIFASTRDTQGNGYFHVIRKGATGWCSPLYELIDYSVVPPSTLSNNYGQLHAVNQTATAATIGFVSHPDNENSMIALKALNKTGSTWQSQKVSSKKKSTAGHFYGREILGFENFMFVTAPYDGTIKPNAGAVYSYKKVGTSWQKTGKILPPMGHANDDVFGTALASNQTYLAIGAAGHEPKGKIFMYKKTSSDWSTVELVQEVTIPEAGLTVYAYGDNIAMDDNWLIVPYVQNAPARVILAIFKFNGTTWDFKQIAEVGNANFFSRESTLDVAIENGVMVAANQIFELNSNGVWEVTCTLSPSDPEPMRISPDFTHWITNGSLFGHSVAIHDNTIFIGAPMRDYENTWDVGAVYVYAKDPNEPWSSRTESIKLVPRVKDESELFGYSVKALYNTLIVGAPGSDYDKKNVARNKPGRAYVFQSEDFYWQSVIPLIDFTGESFEKDYYGISVYLDESDFFIGASIEDIESAKLSGAVYVTPTPPIVKLVPPVCQSGLVDLLGYPFGGTWSGPGLVDAAEGIFDTAVTGPGLKTFTYITESCAYPGTLRILIQPPVEAILQVDTDQNVCAGVSFGRILSVKPQVDCNYQWYYRADTSQPFVTIGGNSSTVSATQRGEYQVKVFNLVCQALSPIISVRDQVMELQLTPLNPVCANQQSVALTAIPAGGQWTGTGVINNSFNPKNISAGMHTLTYKFTSAQGCVFQKTLQVEVRQGFDPVITRLSGNLCENGSVTLGIGGTVPNDMQVSWMSWDAGSNTYNMVAQNVKTITIESNNTFKAKVENLVCESISQPFVLNDQFEVVLSPEENSFEICSDDDIALSFAHTPGNTYQWFFRAAAEDEPVELNASESMLTTINETGYYSATVKRGVCSFDSDPKYVFVLPRDTIFVPNVFTPNGDGLNDDFRIIANQTIVSMDIFNRDGKTIFSGTGTSVWSGGSAPTSVYYWNVVYINCRDQRRSIKGWVHLLR